MTLISVLSNIEAKEFDAPPVFNSVDRKHFYKMTVTLENELKKLRTLTNKVHFLVSSAYFKAQKRFYNGKFLEPDIDYACNLLGVDKQKILSSPYSRKIRTEHEVMIIDMFNYNHFNEINMEEFNNYIYLQVKSYKNPHIIFTDMIDYLLVRKIALPRYRQFVNIISEQIQLYKANIEACLSSCLDDQTKSQLDELILNDGNDKNYNLRFLKRYNQSLRPGNIRKNLDDFTHIKHLYSLIEKPFKSLDFNHEGAMYLTRFVERNRRLHLSQRVDDTRYISLIAFIAYQYFHGHDILADILLQSVQTIKNAVREQIKTQRSEDYIKQNLTFHETVKQTKASLIAPLEQIKLLVLDVDSNPNDCLTKIRDIFEAQQSAIDKCSNNITKIEGSLTPSKQNEAYYLALEQKSRKLQNRVSGIIKSIEFTGDEKLIEAIHNFQNKDITQITAPISFLSSNERAYLKKNFSISLYKALLFLKVAEALKSGSLSLPYSYKYRQLDDYLISKDAWQERRSDYIKQAGLEEFVDIESLLRDSKDNLEKSYKEINKLILKDKTQHITCRDNGAFTVKTPKLENKETHSISNILPYKKDVPIQNVLSIINEQTGFTKDFVHDNPSMHNHKAENNAIFATLIAYGCNVDIPRMARITKGLSQPTLEKIASQYMHINNISRANDNIAKKIDEVAGYFNLSDICHTSSDGQKYNIDGCSLNANASYKYHGSGKGVSSYTFLDNRFAHFYATVISSSEREACYVLDGMMHNNIIKSDIHSTDTHGFTEVVFALMHMMGITFAPRLKNLSAQTLYGFKSSKINKNDFIMPKKYISEPVVAQSWDDVLRFAATIKLRYASSSQLFKRLNSYSKQHVLYKALKEFGRLQKTLFILEYMQDVDFRQAIGKQLNRGENSNKFSKAIAFGNNQEIMFEEKEDQEIAENCRQLIKNSIILWNYLYLVKLLQSGDKDKTQYALATLQKGNVLAWKHILLHGVYDLSSQTHHDEFALADPKIMSLIHTRFWEQQTST